MKTTIFSGLVIWMLAAAPLFTSCSKDNNNEQEQQKEQKQEQGEGEQEQKYDNLKVSVDKTLKVSLGGTATFTIEAGSGEYTVTSANEKVAKATLSEKTVSIQALAVGETEVIVTDAKSKQTAKLTITVMANSHNIAPNEPYYIRLTTQKAIGETIRLNIIEYNTMGRRAWIDLNNNGKKDNGEKVDITIGNYRIDYRIMSQYITIYGNIEELNCSGSHITSLDTNNSSHHLKYLDCSRNNLTSLDVSKNVGLDVLNCGSNSLTSLDISQNKTLKDLSIYKNKFDKANMEKIIGSLPDRKYSILTQNFDGWYDTDETNYKGDELKDLLKNKSWRARIYDTNYFRWEEWR